jgi:biopolymer transport protein ExbB/TolQ
MQSFSVVEMWGNMGGLARAVVIILAIMSLYSLGVMFERFTTFVRAKSRSARVVQGLSQLLSAHDMKGARELAAKKPQPPIARIVGAALDEYASGLEVLHNQRTLEPGDYDVLDAVHRAIERTKEREISDLRRGLGGLATIASAAPFVGLFGTVVGIINAFQSMAATGQGGLAAVSAGIAEALVTTAFGLLVAIPAVMMYNYFTNRVDDFVVDINEISSELVTFLIKDGRSPANHSVRAEPSRIEARR